MNLAMDINYSGQSSQKLFSKTNDADVTYQTFVKNLAKYHFQVKAIIQVSFKM